MYTCKRNYNSGDFIPSPIKLAFYWESTRTGFPSRCLR